MSTYIGLTADFFVFHSMLCVFMRYLELIDVEGGAGASLCAAGGACVSAGLRLLPKPLGRSLALLPSSSLAAFTSRHARFFLCYVLLFCVVTLLLVCSVCRP